MPSFRAIHLREPTHREGFILVVVLWILASISALAVSYTIYVVYSPAEIAVSEQRLKDDALVAAAVEVAAFRQLTARPELRPGQGSYLFRLAQTDIHVSFCSEAARIDINQAPKALLAGLLTMVGLRPAEADRYSDTIVRWRARASSDEVQSNKEGARSKRIIPQLSELVQIPGIPPELANRVSPFATVYSGRPTIDVMDAAPEVLAALPDMTAEGIKAILAQRQAYPNDRQALVRMLGAAQKYATIEVGRTFRLNIQLSRGNGKQKRSEVIIVLFEEGTEPFSILSWRDEIGSQPQSGTTL